MACGVVQFVSSGFKAFVNAFVAIPCQIVRQARQLVCRVLSYHPHMPIFFRLTEVLQC